MILRPKLSHNRVALARSSLGQQSTVTTEHRNENELAEFGFPQGSVVAVESSEHDGGVAAHVRRGKVGMAHLLADLLIDALAHEKQRPHAQFATRFTVP